MHHVLDPQLHQERPRAGRIGRQHGVRGPDGSAVRSRRSGRHPGVRSRRDIIAGLSTAAITQAAAQNQCAAYVADMILQVGFFRTDNSTYCKD